MNEINLMPDFLNIETTSLCNRMCWFCPRTYDRTGTYNTESGKPVKKKMSDETILKILDGAEDSGFGGRVYLNHLCEPSLDNRFIHIAKEIKKRGMHPVINTNGDLLKHNQTLCQEIISVFEHVVIGIYDLSYKAEIEAAKDFWCNRLKGVPVYFSVIPLENKDHTSDAFPRTYVPMDERMQGEKTTHLTGPCHRPMERVIFKYDGRVSLCCEDHLGLFNVGNINDNSFAEIIFSEKRLNILRRLMEGKRDRFQLCCQCTMPPTINRKGCGVEPDHREKY